MSRIRSVAASALFIVVVTGAGVVSGQDYPNKPVHIFTSGAGGGSDFQARLIAPGLTRGLGQPVLVENRPTGLLPQVVAKAAPDGYAVLLTGGTFLISPFLEKTSYDVLRDFVPITWVSSSPSILVVHPSMPVKSVKELIALAKAKPGELNYALGTVGSTGHIAAELFKLMAGVKIVGVPYNSPSQETADLLSGYVQLSFANVARVMPLVELRKLRALGVTTLQPFALHPELPTVAAAVPGYAAVSMTSVMAPAKTPVPIINRLSQEIVRVLNQPDVKKKTLDTGSEVVGSSPEELATAIKSFMTSMGKVVKDAGIKAD